MQPSNKKEDFGKYPTTLRVSKKGQITLPKQYRNEQKLEAGSSITVVEIGSSLLLVPEMEKFNAIADSIERALKRTGLTMADFLETLPETRAEMFAEFYPKLAE